MSAERIFLDVCGLTAGIAMLVMLALTEPARLSRPPVARPIPAPRPPLCEVERASHDMAWEGGQLVVVGTHWRRKIKEPCWYENPTLPSDDHE